MRYKRETMRQRLTEMLTNLGSRIRQVDDAYGRRVAELIYPQAQRGVGGFGSTARAIAAETAGYPATYPLPAIEGATFADSPTQYALARAVSMAMPVGGVAVRYGLPIAGVTAAGQALNELTRRIYESESSDDNLS